ncbi:MAG TPA: DUF3572 family protein [Hyphomicrobiaceae bacterium]|nr:DUF3572 family protein [Hyphomicrobiaceae bacterium]
MDAPAKSAGMTAEAAESIAASALAFLTDDRRRLIRFLSLTGLTPEALMREAAAPSTLAAVLEHLLEEESLLLTFAAGAGIRPADIAPALRLLSGKSA